MEEVCAAQAEDNGHHPRSGSTASSNSGSSGVAAAAAGVTASSEAESATQSVASAVPPIVLPAPESVEVPETAARAVPVTAAAPLQAAPAANQAMTNSSAPKSKLAPPPERPAGAEGGVAQSGGTMPMVIIPAPQPSATTQQVLAAQGMHTAVGGPGANVPPFACAQPCGAPTAGTINGQKEEDLTLIGRVRRWHDKGKWGFVFSELHCSDLYFDSSVIAEGDIMREGVFLLFTAFTDEDGTLCVQSAKIADVDEVRRQQELLTSVYKHYSMRGIKASELPRSVHSYDSQPGAVGSEHTPGGRSSTLSPQEARRGPPPPPQMPPQHVAHTSTGFSAQTQAYPGYQGYAVPNMFQQQWQGGQAILGTTASVATHMDPAPVTNQQLPGANLLLQPPLAFDKLDTKEIVNVLRGGSRPRRRQTLPCNWTGSASRIASDFCQIVRQAMQAALDNGEVHHQHHTQQNQNWGESQWGVWGNGGGDGQLNNGAHGDAYAGAVVNAMGGPVMMNMHGGDSSLHQQQQPC